MGQKHVSSLKNVTSIVTKEHVGDTANVTDISGKMLAKDDMNKIQINIMDHTMEIKDHYRAGRSLTGDKCKTNIQ